jgi:hypothetical protein|tara:strand:- start:4758 stop:5189 length:432 start_codon:yes stop_codon:yes gene_type:complete
MLAFAFFLPSIISTGEQARYTSATVPLSCTTGATANSCNVQLQTSGGVPSPSANTTMEGITVMEQTPAVVDRTPSTTLSNDQSYITISSLTGNTTYTFNVTYPQINSGVGTGLNSLLRALPLLVVIGMAVVLVLGGGRWLSAS